VAVRLEDLAAIHAQQVVVVVVLGQVLGELEPGELVAGRDGRNDVATALALVLMLALGAAFLSRTTEYEPEIYSLLFGEILGVPRRSVLRHRARLVELASLHSSGRGCLMAI
jgi:ABC-type Mn2+/Zn2+ transport system permease subunit